MRLGEEGQTANTRLTSALGLALLWGRKQAAANRFLAATLARSEPNAIHVLQELYVPLI